MNSRCTFKETEVVLDINKMYRDYFFAPRALKTPKCNSVPIVVLSSGGEVVIGTAKFKKITNYNNHALVKLKFYKSAFKFQELRKMHKELKLEFKYGINVRDVMYGRHKAEDGRTRVMHCYPMSISIEPVPMEEKKR